MSYLKVCGDNIKMIFIVLGALAHPPSFIFFQICALTNMQCIATLTVFNQHLHNSFPYVGQYIHF